GDLVLRAQEPADRATHEHVVVDHEHAQRARRLCRRPRTRLHLHGLALLAVGQADREGRAHPEFTAHLDAAAQSFGDIAADGQPEARAHAHRFGGEERVEDASQTLLGDADAGVADAHLHFARALVALYAHHDLIVADIPLGD